MLWYYSASIFAFQHTKALIKWQRSVKSNFYASLTLIHEGNVESTYKHRVVAGTAYHVRFSWPAVILWLRLCTYSRIGFDAGHHKSRVCPLGQLFDNCFPTTVSWRGDRVFLRLSLLVRSIASLACPSTLSHIINCIIDSTMLDSQNRESDTCQRENSQIIYRNSSHNYGAHQPGWQASGDKVY